MPTMLVPSKAKEASIHAVVTRADGTVEALGCISYWHKNPLRRLAWKIRRWTRWLLS